MNSGDASLRTRALLQEIFAAAVACVRGSTLVESRTRLEGDTWIYQHGAEHFRWHLPPNGRVIVIGAGKAAASLAHGMESVLRERIDGGAIVVKYGHTQKLRRIRQFEAGHPVPDLQGESATREILACVANLRSVDRVFLLLTGGASSLLVAPRQGVTLRDKMMLTQLLLRSGAAIEEINLVRKQLSRVKGGGLLEAISAAPCVALVISDVPGNDLATIGSGPLVPTRDDPARAFSILDRYDLRHRIPSTIASVLGSPRPLASLSPPPPEPRQFVLADSAQCLGAAVECSRALGFDTIIVEESMQGDTHEHARSFAAAMKAAAARRRSQHDRATILLAAGETTLAVCGNGRGGRNQEFALMASRDLAGCDHCALLAAGTDGTDGPTDAAGAFADDTTVERAAVVGMDAAAILRDNDSFSLFERLGDLYYSGPTGTNVMDLVIGVAGPIETR